MFKRDPEIINYIFSGKSSKDFRVKYFDNDFRGFCLYYFPAIFSHEMADFQKEYCDDLQAGLSIFFVGFRECTKTTLLKYYYIYMIVYKKRHYLMHYNSDINKAKRFLFSLTLILQDNKRLTDDFGFLYHKPEGRKKTEVTQKTIGEFMIGKDVKVQAMSIGTSPRGASFTAVLDGFIREYRVDFVSMDDIDNDKNIGNSTIIEDDINFIKGEVSGGTSAFCQKVYLGNVITENTRVTELKKHYSKSKNMKLYWIPIRQKGKITWSRFVATDKEAEEKNKKIMEEFRKKGEVVDDSFLFVSLQAKREDQRSIGFNQNFNLIPYRKGQRIIKDSDIKHYYSLPKNYKIVFGIDPAFSEKTGTDGMGLTITAQEFYEKEIFKYVIEMREFVEEEKDEEKFCSVVVDLYHKYKCNLIYIENNNGGGIIGRMLKKRGLAVIILNSEKDKVTRLREYQGEFERGMIKFNPDDTKVGNGIQQLKDFPNVDHDDMVDSMVFSFTPFVGGTIKTF